MSTETATDLMDKSENESLGSSDGQDWDGGEDDWGQEGDTSRDFDPTDVSGAGEPMMVGGGSSDHTQTYQLLNDLPSEF